MTRIYACVASCRTTAAEKLDGCYGCSLPGHFCTWMTARCLRRPVYVLCMYHVYFFYHGFSLSQTVCVYVFVSCGLSVRLSVTLRKKKTVSAQILEVIGALQPANSHYSIHQLWYGDRLSKKRPPGNRNSVLSSLHFTTLITRGQRSSWHAVPLEDEGFPFSPSELSAARRQWDTILNNLFKVETQREENK